MKCPYPAVQAAASHDRSDHRGPKPRAVRNASMRVADAPDADCNGGLPPAAGSLSAELGAASKLPVMLKVD